MILRNRPHRRSVLPVYLIITIFSTTANSHTNNNNNYYSNTTDEVEELTSELAAANGYVAEQNEEAAKCGSRSQQLKYTWGDALSDPSNCIGPNNLPYPTTAINRMFRKNWLTSSRTGRRAGNFGTTATYDPAIIRQNLLKNYQLLKTVANDEVITGRSGRDFSHRDICQSNPSRLCKTRYNTTAPMYGVSLTSGQPVTIVQKFPDLLQQVIYEVCESNECDIVRGECTQTYVPYLFLVIPLGPVTLTGQDYVLVESGCICKPKFSTASNVATDPLTSLP